MGAPHRRRQRLFKQAVRFIRTYLSRRSVLKRLGAVSAVVAAAPAITACGGSGRAASAGTAASPGAGNSMPGGVRFQHGVASGDPLPDRVIIWTRVTPEQPETAGNIPVDWIIATDPELTNMVNAGSFVTDAARDFTVKLDATGLASFTTYYYGFRVGDTASPVGRTRTAPRAGETERLRVGVAACSNFTAGFFNGYATMAQRRDLDLVLHLGDYIYEGGESALRSHRPAREIVSLAEYRERYAQYREDPDLQEAHRQHPWVVIWDDHETANNSYKDGAANHQPATEGDWAVREGQAVRAYFEWLPIRDNMDNSFDAPEMGLKPDGNGRIYRTLEYGGLADFVMLDTRLAGRVEQAGGTGFVPSEIDPEQTILGTEQRDWFLNELQTRTATWKIVGQQMTFAPLMTQPDVAIAAVPGSPAVEGAFLNDDAWDGYRTDRIAVFDTLEDNAIDNVVFLSGDIHATIALDVPREPNDLSLYDPLTGDGSLCVEFCCNAIANIPIPVWTALRATNPHLKHSNEIDNGYLLLDITPERVQGEWYYSISRINRLPLERPDPIVLLTTDGANHLTLGTPSSPKNDPPPLAP